MKLAPFIASVLAFAWLLASAPASPPSASEHLDLPPIMSKIQDEQEQTREGRSQLADSTRAKQLTHFGDTEAIK